MAAHNSKKNTKRYVKAIIEQLTKSESQLMWTFRSVKWFDLINYGGWRTQIQSWANSQCRSIHWRYKLSSEQRFWVAGRFLMASVPNGRKDKFGSLGKIQRHFTQKTLSACLFPCHLVMERQQEFVQVSKRRAWSGQCQFLRKPFRACSYFRLSDLDVV